MGIEMRKRRSRDRLSNLERYCPFVCAPDCMRSLRVPLVTLAAMLVLTACSQRQWNSPISDSNPVKDYVFANRLPLTNAQDVFVVLAFSGGGLRSAAFSYGVLEKLRATSVTIHGQKKRLLDEVDVITAVSGGSFTAAYYGLFGEQIFSNYEAQFLHKDIDGQLLSLLANPINLISISRNDYNRADLVARWFGNNIYENRTFDQMSLDGLPYVIINSSDLNSGLTFPFIQQQFDFLCSSISDYPVASAVTASSAVPGLFGAIALRNYDTDCSQRRNSWIGEVLENPDIFSRDYYVASMLNGYSSPETTPIVRLVDGGMTDNIGVRGSMMSPVAHYGNVSEMAGAFSPEALSNVRTVLVVLANAQTYRDYEWSLEGDDPGIVATLRASYTAALSILNSETITLARQGFNMWRDVVNQSNGHDKASVEIHFAVLTLSQIADATESKYFNSIPTSLALGDEEISNLRELAGRLLQQSKEFQSFIESLRSLK